MKSLFEATLAFLSKVLFKNKIPIFRCPNMSSRCKRTIQLTLQRTCSGQDSVGLTSVSNAVLNIPEWCLPFPAVFTEVHRSLEEHVSRWLYQEVASKKLFSWVVSRSSLWLPKSKCQVPFERDSVPMTAGHDTDRTVEFSQICING